MAKEFKLKIVSPERLLVDAMSSSVLAPGSNGYLGVLFGHEPSTITLRPGLVVHRDHNGDRHFVAIDGGFMHIKADEVSILADNAVHSAEVDEAKAEEALELARKALRREVSGMTTDEAMLEIERATARIRAARKIAPI